MLGGFVGGWAVLSHGVFASAETTNLIYLSLSLLGTDFKDCLIRIGAVVIYFISTMSTVFISRKFRTDIRKFAVAADALCLVTLPFIPEKTDVFISLYPVFFAMAFQWNSFKGANGYISSTIFSTNNLRQVALSLANYLSEKNIKHLAKMIFFLSTLVFFHIGVAVSYLFYKISPLFCPYAGLVIVLIVYILILQDAPEKRENSAA